MFGIAFVDMLVVVDIVQDIGFHTPAVGCVVGTVAEIRIVSVAAFGEIVEVVLWIVVLAVAGNRAVAALVATGWVAEAALAPEFAAAAMDMKCLAAEGNFVASSLLHQMGL